MAYSRQTWNNGNAGGTPISASRLNHLEAGLENADVTNEASEANAYLNVAVPGIVETVGDGRYAPRLKVYVDSFGADPTGGTSSDAAIVAAKAALGTKAGVLVFGAGTYRYTTPLVFTISAQGIEAAGRGITFLQFEGSNATALTHRPTTFSSSAQGGRQFGYTLQGNGSTNSNGLDVGDMVGLTVDDVRVRSFTGAYGARFGNAGGWIEQADITLSAGGNAGTQVIFDGGSVAGVSESFMYNRIFLKLYVGPNTDGLKLQNGANIFGGRFGMIFNCQRSAGNTGTLMRIGNVEESSPSGFLNAGVTIVGEVNGTGDNHIPLVMAGMGVIRDGGTVWVHGGGWPASTLLSGRVSFSGRWTLGSGSNRQSFNLAHQSVGGTARRTMDAAYVLSSGTLTIDPDFGTDLRIQLGTGAHTVVWGGGVASGESTGLTQEVNLALIQPASGTAATITWPGTITWVGGAPSLKVAASTIDHIRLLRMPNGTWYGFHLNPWESIGSAQSQWITPGKLWVHGGSSANTWTLPNVGSAQGRSIEIKNIATANLTVVPQASEFIYDTSEASTMTLATGDGVRLMAQGVRWYVIART